MEGLNKVNLKKRHEFTAVFQKISSESLKKMFKNKK